ncbi:hypothetical protein C8R43DRAFT_267420 [Mycena crocata]|nr:hypothetical protein C8R43DRAFT_267420 [Mycena crocata]
MTDFPPFIWCLSTIVDPRTLHKNPVWGLSVRKTPWVCQILEILIRRYRNRRAVDGFQFAGSRESPTGRHVLGPTTSERTMLRKKTNRLCWVYGRRCLNAARPGRFSAHDAHLTFIKLRDVDLYKYDCGSIPSHFFCDGSGDAGLPKEAQVLSALEPSEVDATLQTSCLSSGDLLQYGLYMLDSRRTGLYPFSPHILITSSPSPKSVENTTRFASTDMTCIFPSKLPKWLLFPLRRKTLFPGPTHRVLGLGGSLLKFLLGDRGCGPFLRCIFPARSVHRDLPIASQNYFFSE